MTYNWNEMDVIVKIALAVLVIVVVIAVFGLSGWLTMWAWNIVMPFLFNLPVINFWQAIGINVLIGLFKGIIGTTTSK